MTAKRMNRIPVSKRALVQRVNRALEEGMKLKATRGERLRQEVGDYFVVDLNRNAVMEKHIELEEIGRRLEVLAEWEQLEVEA